MSYQDLIRRSGISVRSFFFGFVSRMNCGEGHSDGDGIFAGGQGSQPKSERGHVGTGQAGSGRKKLAGEWRCRPLLKILPIIEDWEVERKHGLFEENNNYYYLSSIKNSNNAAVFGVGIRTYSCSRKKVEHRMSSLVVMLGVMVYLRTLLSSFCPPAVYISTTLQRCSGTLRCASCR
jgi:hypothetical protein